jgi:hypothetical protein
VRAESFVYLGDDRIVKRSSGGATGCFRRERERSQLTISSGDVRGIVRKSFTFRRSGNVEQGGPHEGHSADAHLYNRSPAKCLVNSVTDRLDGGHLVDGVRLKPCVERDSGVYVRDNEREKIADAILAEIQYFTCVRRPPRTDGRGFSHECRVARTVGDRATDDSDGGRARRDRFYWAWRRFLATSQRARDGARDDQSV